ncbi:hypothetical protein Pmar_PMAR026415, partial [Perkinsus marinus ATCC 50983]
MATGRDTMGHSALTAAAGAVWDHHRRCWALEAAVDTAKALFKFKVDSPNHCRTHCIACQRKILENDLRIGYPAEDRFSADGVRSLFLHVHCLPEELVSNDEGLAKLCRDRNSAGIQAWLAGHVVGFEALTKKKKAMLVQGFCETQPPAAPAAPMRSLSPSESEEPLTKGQCGSSVKSTERQVNPSYADVCESTPALKSIDKVARELLPESPIETPGLADCVTPVAPTNDKCSKYLGAWRLTSGGCTSGDSASADHKDHYSTATGEQHKPEYLGSWRTEAANYPGSNYYSVGAPVRLVPSYRSGRKGHHSEPYWSYGKSY